jgi:hypothetical protein
MSLGGVQPVVRLTADGGARTDVAPGVAVSLRAEAEVPGAGKIIQPDWELDGDAAYEVSEAVEPTPDTVAEQTTSFTEPGTYFVTVRVTAQREDDPTTPFARVANLARARIVVRDQALTAASTDTPKG